MIIMIFIMLSISKLLLKLQDKYQFMHRDLHLQNIVHGSGDKYFIIDLDFARVLTTSGEIISQEHSTEFKDIFNPTLDLRQIAFEMMIYSEEKGLFQCRYRHLPHSCSLLTDLVNRYETTLGDEISEWYQTEYSQWPCHWDRHLWTCNIHAMRFQDQKFHPTSVIQSFENLLDKLNSASR